MLSSGLHVPASRPQKPRAPSDLESTVLLFLLCLSYLFSLEAAKEAKVRDTDDAKVQKIPIRRISQATLGSFSATPGAFSFFLPGSLALIKEQLRGAWVA